jgi:hypothetical protein
LFVSTFSSFSVTIFLFSGATENPKNHMQSPHREMELRMTPFVYLSSDHLFP